ncbi:hypothetical protein [Chryseosolibacter indicus]|uniref:Uncharacterized protein n=1 Tax=Chryseosolibacter indicus TaxID=2782351 RepID=A0ABS5VTS3_9BACT|nr:hypothetical protein [Chryseosolibacter indicus]MBT1704240.1 hypothetical protein [Chryseosolibacter indicus]
MDEFSGDNIQWKSYNALNKNAGIQRYAIGDGFIVVMFNGSEEEIYVYHDKVIDTKHINEMKRLAEQGKGLTTYINQHQNVRDNAIKFEPHT